MVSISLDYRSKILPYKFMKAETMVFYGDCHYFMFHTKFSRGKNAEIEKYDTAQVENKDNRGNT